MAKTAGKYHIGRDGTPSLCKAISGKCPFTSNSHFATFAQAAEVSNELFAKEYGLWEDEEKEYSETREVYPGVDFFQATYTDENGSGHYFNKIIKGLSNDKKRAGLDYEAYGAFSYAEEHSLDNVILYDNQGRRTVLSDEGVSENKVNEVYNSTQNKVIEKLKSNGKEIVDKEKLISGIYFSKESSTVVAQLGGPETLDIAVIKGDEVEFIEHKRGFGSGAQLPSVALTVNKDGNPIIKDKDMDPIIKREVERVGFKSTFKTNVAINVTEKESLSYLVSSYQRKGASKLTIMDKRGRNIEFDLNGSKESIVNSLEEKGVKASVKLRSNMTFNSPTEEDKERWRNKRGEYFKSNEFPKESFSLNDLKTKPSEFGLCGGRVAVGELVLPYSRKELMSLPKDKKIKVSSLKTRGLTLIGSIKA